MDAAEEREFEQCRAENRDLRERVQNFSNQMETVAKLEQQLAETRAQLVEARDMPLHKQRHRAVCNELDSIREKHAGEIERLQAENAELASRFYHRIRVWFKSFRLPRRKPRGPKPTAIERALAQRAIAHKRRTRR